MSLLLFKKEFATAIRSGSKTTTLRRWARPRVGVGRRAFAPGIGWLFIEAVDQVELEALDDRDASSDGFASMAAMLKKLTLLYPTEKLDGKQWYRVRFRADELLPSLCNGGPSQSLGDSLLDLGGSEPRGEDLQAP
jgi:hypothetical protein